MLYVIYTLYVNIFVSISRYPRSDYTNNSVLSSSNGANLQKSK